MIKKRNRGPYWTMLYNVPSAAWVEFVETCPSCGEEIRYNDDEPAAMQPTLILKFDPIDRIDKESGEGGICFTEIHRCKCGELFMVDDVCYSLEELDGRS